MPILEEVMGIKQNQSRKLLVAIRFDSDCKELISWAIVKVAEIHDHVVVIHVCRNSGTIILPNLGIIFFKILYIYIK